MRKACVVNIKFFVLFLLFFVLNAQGGSFALKVNDVSGMDAPWPLVASIPFPKGELSDVSAVRITGGGMEVPSQVDVAARWRDGSIRWALGGFTASPQGEYTVEYGEGVKRGVHTVPLKVDRSAGGGFSVDTGAAVYRFESDKLLPEEAWLAEGRRRIQILQGAGAGAYLVDNAGRQARVSGEAAEIEHKVLKEGPGRFVIKRSGYYVTEEGERLARAEAWFYFSAGSPYVRITHRIIFTEDTNKVWFKDYGLEFKTPVSPRRVFCALGEPGKEDIREVNAQGGEVYLLQDQYPHFAEREYRAVIGKSSGGEDAMVEEIPVAGDWAHGDYGNYGITLAMPWLAQRFPKELSFGQSGARAVLWSGRSKRELDFRGRTLAEEYWQDWVSVSAIGKEAVSNWPSNAQGSARTHDVWLLPHAGAYNEPLVRKAAAAGARAPLVMAEPGWLCATDAMGQPMLHKDTGRFPAEEAAISEYWQRFILPMRAFPTNGFISWGHFPFWRYVSVGGRIMPTWNITTQCDPYGMRREPWILYARSGERTYYEYAHGFNRLTGDWYIAHMDVHGDPDDPRRNRGKQRGCVLAGQRNLPFFWGEVAHSKAFSGVSSHWLFEYYLTGDESSKDMVDIIKDEYKTRWDIEGEIDSAIEAGTTMKGYPIKLLRKIVTLSIMDWDEETLLTAKRLAHSQIDLKNQNAVSTVALDSLRYGVMYKDARNSRNLLEYYMETGDELAKEAFLKLMDHRYRFNRLNNQVGYKCYEGFTHSCAYWMTGEQRYRRVAEQTVRDALRGVQRYPLSRELEGLPEDPLEWKTMPDCLAIHECFNPMMGLPTALKLIAEEGWSGKPFPLAGNFTELTEGKFVFSHRQGEDTKLSLYFFGKRSDIMPAVFRYPEVQGEKPLSGIKVEMEKRIQWPEVIRRRLPENDIYHAYVTVPSEMPGGLYLVSIGGPETFILLDATAEKAALYCPEGFWTVSATPYSLNYGQLGEGTPMFFRVPENLNELKILLTRPARVKRADGSVAVDITDEKVGYVDIPVEGKSGVWAIEPYIYSFKGECPPVFFKLLNVEPIISFGTSDLLPEIDAGQLRLAAAEISESAAEAGFTDGLQGKSLYMTGGKKLAFPRGETVDKGGYAYFPGNKGTAEFWYRASRNTHEIPLLFFENREFTFIQGPHLILRHSYRVLDEKAAVRNNHSMLQLELITREPLRYPLGFQSAHFFKANQWVHIAYAWNMENAELAVFLNGKKLPYYLTRVGSRPPGVHQLKADHILTLSDKSEEIIFGPFEGSMDMLRISDIVRYTEDFVPEKTVPEMDEHTRALFLFDGSLKGVSAFSADPIEVR